MSTILQLDSTYDLWLSQTWSNNNHGISGHTFEILDYYHILRKHFKTGILLCEDIDWQTLERAIRSKYDFTDDEIADIRINTVFANRPKVVKANAILFVDGGVINASNYVLLCNRVLHFACGNREVMNNTKANTYILQDNRVYEPVQRNGINYKKKILFDRLKPIQTSGNKTLVYATKNCRNIEDYNDLKQYGDLLVITNEENRPVGIDSVVPPVDNLFELFSTYVYTPIQRQWDCSPRFIAECKYYGKQVIFHNIDYWDVDHGLRWRQWDIDHDFDSLYLREDDEIVCIISQVIS